LEAGEPLMRAIRVHTTGGPEVLSYETDAPAPQPAPGEVLIRVGAAGVNFIDIYHRSGRYNLPLPFSPGQEAAGRVAALGEGVTDFKVGDRAACFVGSGAYAEFVRAPAVRTVPVPEGLDDRSAAAAIVQGLTAHYLTRDSFPIQPGQTVLVHAAAGGLGLLLTQMAVQRGARVIGTVSTPAKAELARGAGARDVILYAQTDFEAEVKRLTDGRGVDCVYDSVGKTTFDQSLNCLRPLGSLVLCGGSSGPVPPFDPLTLMTKGSLFLTRPTLGHYVPTAEALRRRAADVYGWILNGQLKLRLEHSYPLAQAAQAHRDLESRATTGKLALLLD
jgi:NADPH2:quinone reductase